MASEISKYLARIGRKGGRSRSAAKLAAVVRTLRRPTSPDVSTRRVPVIRIEATGFRPVGRCAWVFKAASLKRSREDWLAKPEIEVLGR